MSLTVLALMSGMGLGAMAWTCGDGVRRWPGLCSKLPRHRLVGGILGLLVLIWAAHHGCAMLEDGLARFRVLVRVAVPVVAILAYTHLDYLFARSLGGALLLVVNELLHAGFAEHVAARPVFSVVCYAIGICGLVLVAAPWRLRDLLEQSSVSVRWRYGAACVFAGAGIVLLLLAVLPG